MMKTVKTVALIALAVVLLGIVSLVLLLALLKTMLPGASYPQAGSMPPVVGESMDEVLARLEAALKKHAPESLSHLQPGLSVEKIAELERESALPLSDELRALFRWRNGVPPRDFTDITPLERFRSLEELIEHQKAGEQQLQAATPAMRAAHDAIVGYTKPWIPIFQDPAGDGYYYDPTRRPEQGAVFYSFLETGTLHFYPSLKNLLVAIAECYETGAYSVNAEGTIVDEFEKSHAIHAKYCAEANW